MKSAADIAREIVPEPDNVGVQGDPSWVREDIEVVLRPLIAVLKRAVYEQHSGERMKCCICGWSWWTGVEPCHGDHCPIPDALEVLKP